MVFTGGNGAGFELFGKPDRGVRGYEQTVGGGCWTKTDYREQRTDGGGRKHDAPEKSRDLTAL